MHRIARDRAEVLARDAFAQVRVPEVRVPEVRVPEVRVPEVHAVGGHAQSHVCEGFRVSEIRVWVCGFRA